VATAAVIVIVLLVVLVAPRIVFFFDALCGGFEPWRADGSPLRGLEVNTFRDGRDL
jgi:hypothetical protein